LAFGCRNLREQGGRGAPHKDSCCPLTWTTVGSGIIGGDEKGYVQYDVLSPIHGREELPSVLGTVTFRWSNPLSGTNTCSIDKPPQDIAVGCTIPPHGSEVYVDYCVDYNPTSSTCKAEPYNPGKVLEKKPLHTYPSGKMVLPHHQAHFMVKNSMIVSTPKTSSSTSGGTSSKATSGGAVYHIATSAAYELNRNRLVHTGSTD